MIVKVKLINLDDDIFQESFDLAKVDAIQHEGHIKALDEIPNVMEIDCFKLPNDLLMDIVSNIISTYAVSKWMSENGLKLTDDNGKPIKE